MPATVEELQKEIENLRKTLTTVVQSQQATAPTGSQNQPGNSAAVHSTFINPVPSPSAFSFRKEDWQVWITHFERYRIATQMDKTEQKSQINSLLLHMGAEVTRLLRTLQKTEESFENYNEVRTFFDKYFVETTNLIYARAKFNLRKQKEDESAHEYISALIELAKSCNFRALESELIRDRLVVGIKDERLSETLQLDSTLTLEKAIEKISQAERVKNENKELRDEVESVNRVNTKYLKRSSNHKNKSNNQEQWKEQRKQPQSSKCPRCGAKPAHSRNQCPASNQRCLKCKFLGHYASKCRTKNARAVDQEDTDSDSRSSEDELPNQDYKVRRVVNINTVKGPDPWKTKLYVGNTSLTFRIDTGADATIISLKKYNEFLKHDYPAEQTSVKLMGPGNNKLDVFGKVKIPVRHLDKSENLRAYIVDTPENLLGKPALTKLNMVEWKSQRMIIKNTINKVQKCEMVAKKIKKQYPSLFNGIGNLKNYEYKITLAEDAEPFAISTPRRVPFPLMENVKNELKKMVEEGIIQKIDEPTEWCAPMVIAVRKNGKVRICGDYTEINKFIKRERYQLPSVDETLGKLQEAKLFTKLDFANGFWQINLSPETQKLTTFITPFGRFVYRRLPFGISSAPEVFQKEVNNVIGKLDSSMIHAHADDILVTGRNEREHDENLHSVLRILQEHGLTLNVDKCIFKDTQTKYLGYVVGADGMKIDPSSIESIKKFPSPRTVTELKRFLGMINYVAKFVPKMADNTKYLRELLRQDRDFTWNESCQKQFESLKQLVVSSPVLAQFCRNKKTRVSADASSYGIGAVLEQMQSEDVWRPVYYCSKSLSEAEKRYAQIEKEALAITWACERLEQFLLGSSFVIQTDHKPLTVILETKEINQLSHRLQRFRMRLLKFKYTVVHVPGRSFVVPDALSRAPLPTGLDDEDVQSKDLPDIYINAVLREVNAEMCSEDRIRTKQREDADITNSIKFVVEGWPNKKVKSEYLKYRDHLSVSDGILLYNDRVVIPASLRRWCLEVVHEGHFGIAKCLTKARNTVWWPGMSGQIKDRINNCETCLKHRQPLVDPMIPTTVPNRPWEVIGADLAVFNGTTYIVCQDYYSRFPEVRKLKNYCSQDVINFFRDIFSRHGIPDVVRTDNGRQFDCREFKQFSKSYGFKWVSSSPEYQQSNGQAESAVKLLKKVLKKSEDFYLGLLAYRNRPLSCGFSPAELLFGRNLKERLPTTNKGLEPKTIDHNLARRSMIVERENQKRNYDQRHRVKERDDMGVGDRVWIINMKREGVIESRAEEPRSYWIQTEKHRVRRNRRHLQVLPPKDHVEPDPATEHTPSTVVRPKRTVKMPSKFKDYQT